ncbi:MAG: RNA polymerase sigma factor [Pirellulaceae bacterium]|nr:RNA polymerase sigma factor [Pirellulaceae bacterium]
MSDEQLMERFIRQQDRDCFEVLMRRYQFEVYNYLRRYLGNDHYAEDAFQATFLRVFLRGQQFDVTRRFRPWLYGIATHQAIDFQRSNQSARRMLSLDSSLSSHLDGISDIASQLADHREPSGREADLLEQREQIRAVLDELGEPGKSAVELVYLRGMAYRDAAQTLNVPVGTIKSRIHAAVRKLAAIWQRRYRKPSK